MSKRIDEGYRVLPLTAWDRLVRAIGRAAPLDARDGSRGALAAFYTIGDVYFAAKVFGGWDAGCILHDYRPLCSQGGRQDRTLAAFYTTIVHFAARVVAGVDIGCVFARFIAYVVARAAARATLVASAAVPDDRVSGSARIGSR